MSGLWLGYKIIFRKNKQKNQRSAAKRSEGASMTTQRMRGRSKQAQCRKKVEHIGRFNLFLYRGISTVHRFSCMCNAVCDHVTYTGVTVHGSCEGLKSMSYLSKTYLCNLIIPTKVFCKICKRWSGTLFHGLFTA